MTNIRDGGAGFDLRTDNTIGYISPNWGPVHLFAAYITDHNLRPANSDEQPSPYPITDNSDFNAISVAAMYDQKNVFGDDTNLYLALGWEQHKIQPAAGAKDSEKAFRVTGKYDFGNWAIPLFYQKGSDLGWQSGNDRDVFGGGLSYKMGANTLKGAIYAAGEDGITPDSGGILYSFGVDHAMSKNIQVYAQAAILTEDTNGTITLGGSGHGAAVAGVADKTSWGLSVGSRIKF
jgi:predicted porin